MTPDSDGDLAGPAYWDGVWERTGEHHVGRFSYFHYAFSRLFDSYLKPGSHVCEVGCADSAWVPYFVRRGIRVTGIDYSTKGIARLQHTLAREGLRAHLVHADLLDPEFRPAPVHDLVFSIGLIEHFQDPTAVLCRMRGLLKDGGVLVTLVPNLVGAWGFLQARLDARIFHLHIPYDRSGLDDAHGRAGFQIVEPARYFGVFGPLILNAPELANRYPRAHGIATACLWLLQQATAWPLGVALGRRINTRFFSSHLVGVYRAITINSQ